MKRTILPLLLLFISIGLAQAQILEPVTWSASASPKKASIGDVITLEFTAKIEEDWYLYSSDFDPDLGPQVTRFEFAENGTFELVGGLQPIKPKKKYDDLWEGEYTYFVHEGSFQQKVRILQENIQIEALMRGQTCTDITGKCIPLEEEFKFDQSDIEVLASAAVKEEPKEEQVATTTKNSPQEANTHQEKEVKTASKEEVTPKEAVEPQKEESTPTPSLSNGGSTQQFTEGSSPKEEEQVEESTDQEAFTANQSDANLSLMSFLLLAFIGGLGAIFTPCVFPMIPLTVSFFSGKKGMGQAFFYGFSIVLIYVLLGAILAAVLGPAGANALSTHWIPNLIFFAVFIAFALSFFGMFEIELPSNFVNKMDRMADQKGGLLGVFFMAFTLTLVSFSCTGPIVGSLLVASAQGELLRPILGMASFGAAFALPFVVFALFPSLLNKLPQSGGWLNSVKVTLGFVELALAFKFLSMIDLVYHLGILDRDLNIAIWIAIFSFMGLYYLGKIQLPHDSPIDKVSVPRMLMALASFVFVIYLIPGLFGAPLKALSGVLPPTQTHDFDLHRVIRENSGSGGQATAQQSIPAKKYADLFEMPHGFPGYFDYEEGMAAARKLGKPVMLDFTGHGCANCRKMEDNVWIDPAVRSRLENDWVIIELYVDDPTKLPESEWITSERDGKVKKTIGAVNMDFEITQYENNAQPLYVLLDHEGNLLADGMGYDPNVKAFVNFLDRGMKEFKKR